MNQHLKRSLAWNVIELCVYQSLFALHQGALFRTLCAVEYGVLQTWFSTTYLLSYLSMSGIDAAHAAFFPRITNSKQTYRTFLKAHIAPLFGILALLGGVTSCCLQNWYPHALTYTVAPFLVIFSETARRTAKSLCKLLRKNQHCTLIESVALIIYLCVVWGMQSLLGYTLSAAHCIWPLVCTSGFSAFCYALVLNRWYHTIPCGAERVAPTFFGEIARSRLKAWGYQISRQLSSSNFFVAAVGFLICPEQAGIVAMVSTVVHSIHTVIQQTTGATFLSALANPPNASAHQSSNSVWYRIAPVAAFCLLATTWRFQIWSSGLWPLTTLCVCGILASLEYVWILQEKLHIQSDRSHSLIIATSLTPLLFFIAIWLLPVSSPVLFITLIASRFASYSYLKRGHTRTSEEPEQFSKHTQKSR